MSKIFVPRTWQPGGIRFLMQHKRCALWADMGIGKSVMTLTALDGLSVIEPVFPALILAPYRVANKTWPDELKEWDHLSHLEIANLTGMRNPDREAAFKQKAHFYTLNFEHLPWLVEFFGAKWPFKTVVVDEATRLKSFRVKQGGARAGSLGKIVKAGLTSRFIELSGTPSPNGVKDLWGQLWFLDQGARLGRSFDAFKKRWFTLDWDKQSIIPLPHAQNEIQDRISDICYSIRAEDHLDLEKPISVPVYVDLPSDVRTKYRELERLMFTELQGEQIEAVHAAAKTMKCLQFASGAAYVGEDNTRWIIVHDEKIKALESIVEEAAGAPLLVAYQFKSDLARLLKAFPQGRELDKKPETIDAWNKGRIPLLFAHPASAGHGLNLQHGGHRLVFFTHNWNLEEHQQIIERIGPVRQFQAGYRRPVYIYHIVARGTVEELVMKRLETKRSIQDILMKAMGRIT